jgi:hypothetical protein
VGSAGWYSRAFETCDKHGGGCWLHPRERTGLFQDLRALKDGKSEEWFSSLWICVWTFSLGRLCFDTDKLFLFKFCTQARRVSGMQKTSHTKGSRE